MLNSNQSFGGSKTKGMYNSNNIAKNLQTVDNIKLRRQMRSLNQSMIGGNAKSLANSVSASGMNRPVRPIQKVPAVRKRTAKEYHE
jgi:hypothetical protein